MERNIIIINRWVAKGQPNMTGYSRWKEGSMLDHTINEEDLLLYLSEKRVIASQFDGSQSKKLEHIASTGMFVVTINGVRYETEWQSEAVEWYNNNGTD